MKDCYLGEVVSSNRITPNMIRIELGGADLARFVTSDFADEWVRLVFPAANGVITMPRMVDGRWQMPGDMPRSPMRPYTVRHWNSAEGRMLIDFVVHEGGIASDWASSARTGDTIGLTSPQGKYAPPDNTGLIVLVADATGLPAACRIMEEHQGICPIQAHLEIPSAEDIPGDINPEYRIAWSFGFGLHSEITRLEEIWNDVRLPERNSYIWVAGETRIATLIRRQLLDVAGFEKERVTAIGYWTRGKTRD